MKPFARDFYFSMGWKNTRDAYKKSVGGLCEICWANGIPKAGELVHHKIPLTPENINDTNITLNWDNLQCVCRECHHKLHEHRPQRKRRYQLDELGRVVFERSP